MFLTNLNFFIKFIKIPPHKIENNLVMSIFSIVAFNGHEFLRNRVLGDCREL